MKDISECTDNNTVNGSRYLEFLPSFSWVLVMVVPFLILFKDLAPDARKTQLFGIVIVFICLFIGDKYSNKNRLSLSIKNTRMNIILSSPWLYIISFFIIGVYHIAQMDKIPLFEKYFNSDMTAIELSKQRELASKLLNIPYVFKYLFSCATSIILPLSFLLLIKTKKYMIALCYYILGMIYCGITLAKGPMVLFSLIVGVFFFNKIIMSSFFKKYQIFFLIILLIFFSRFASVLIFNPMSGFNYRIASNINQKIILPENDIRKNFTLADHFRVVPQDTISTEIKLYNYIIYRIFLVPAEVSNRWYQYFPEINGGYEGLSDLLPGGRGINYVHPSRKVGLWAYYETMPDLYGKTVNAYASIDADAYARLGIAGIFISSLLLLILRLMIKKFFIKNILGESLYIIAIVQISSLVGSASIQAIFVAHGMVLIIVLMSINYIDNSDYFKNLKVYQK